MLNLIFLRKGNVWSEAPGEGKLNLYSGSVLTKLLLLQIAACLEPLVLVNPSSTLPLFASCSFILLNYFSEGCLIGVVQGQVCTGLLILCAYHMLSALTGMNLVAADLLMLVIDLVAVMVI
jgi:hypothetical protein